MHGTRRSRSSGFSDRARQAYHQTRIDLSDHRGARTQASHYAASSGRYTARNTRGNGRAPAKAELDKRGGRSQFSGSDRSKTMSRSKSPAAVRTVPRAAILLFVCVLMAVACAAAVLWIHPFGIGTSGGTGSGNASIVGANGSLASDDNLPTPIMAESEGVMLHSAVAMDDLTEILIHNASYSYACPLETQLVEATNSVVKANGGTGRVASTQPTGDEWMTGEFIRTYRSGNAGPKLSAIDCGGAVGTQVYAPVSGTVVLVKAYKLYEKYDDYQIHIQPDGHPELDVVLIHLTDPSVEAGDTVEGGVTPIAKIRDVYAYIGESMQLKNYTAEGDNGNHTHIQVNDVNNAEYHGLDDLKQTDDTSQETQSS